MKIYKIIAATTAVLCLSGCGTAKPEPEHARYVMQGRCYERNIWEDTTGNLWKYTTDAVSKVPVYDGMPVYICFDDAGTPDNIYDDEVLGLVYDRETAIYDSLEASLSDAFELERDGNKIRITKEE